MIAPATTWTQLVERYGEFSVAALAREQARLDEIEAWSDARLLRVFSGNDVMLARLFALCGNGEYEQVLSVWHRLLPRLANAVVSSERMQHVTRRYVLYVALVLECKGYRLDAVFDSQWLNGLIGHRHFYNDAQVRTMALASLALGDTDLALAFIDASPMDVEWESGKRFEFNTFDLIRYLAQAIDADVGHGDLENCWNEFLSVFPLNLAADASDWPDLFFVRGAICKLSGREMKHVSSDVHSAIKGLVG